jgi:uncharacterized protein YbjT (DUF2867 family)
VAWSLLERGIGVRALTRDPEKPEARELAVLAGRRLRLLRKADVRTVAWSSA